MRCLSVLRIVLIATCLWLAVSVTGCSSFSRNRLDENVLAGRQLSLRGIEAMQQARWGDAEALISESVRLCPTDERIRAQYAETLWNLHARQDAILHMQLAVKLSGGNPDLLVRLGDMHLEQGDLDLAAAQADRAIAANRHLAAAWALRGDVFQRQGDDAQSLASYHRALGYSSPSHYPRVQLAIAESYRKQGRHGRALATLRRLADGYPVDEVPAQVRFLEGLAQKELGRYDGAIASLTAAIRKSSASPEYLFHLAETHLLMGDTVNARIAIGAALAADPAHQPSHQLVNYLDYESRGRGAAGGRLAPQVVRASGTQAWANVPPGSEPSDR